MKNDEIVMRLSARYRKVRQRSDQMAWKGGRELLMKKTAPGSGLSVGG